MVLIFAKHVLKEAGSRFMELEFKKFPKAHTPEKTRSAIWLVFYEKSRT